jgi:hypothetical protein
MSLALGQTDKDGYNLSDGSSRISTEFLLARIEAIFVEFLSMSSTDTAATQANLTKNHVVYKIDFAKPVLGFEGARLAMDISFDSEYSLGRDGYESKFQPGRLNLKPVRFKGASTSSARTFQLSVARGLTLGLLISVLMSQGLQFFGFAIIGDRYFGCRDFMYCGLLFTQTLTICLSDQSYRVQSLLLFEKHDYIRRNIVWSHIDNLLSPFLSIIDNLGMRWKNGRTEASPIDMGNFPRYRRPESSSVPYDGSQRSSEIEQILRQM